LQKTLPLFGVQRFLDFCGFLCLCRLSDDFGFDQYFAWRVLAAPIVVVYSWEPGSSGGVVSTNPAFACSCAVDAEFTGFRRDLAEFDFDWHVSSLGLRI
jgi:hypothetical protein